MTGECVVVRDGAGVRVDRADLNVMISLELLASLREGPDAFAEVTDHELIIRATNGRFVYEVGDWAEQLVQARADLALDPHLDRVIRDTYAHGRRTEPVVEATA